MSSPRQSKLFDARTGWGTGAAVNIGTLGPQGLHLVGSGGVARAFAAVPAWLAAPAWAATADQPASPGQPAAWPGQPAPAGEAEPPGAGPPRLLVYVLGLDGRLRRFEPLTSSFVEIFRAADYGIAAADDIAVAASRADVYVLDPLRARVLVISGLGYLRQILQPPAPWAPTAICGLPDGAAVLDTWQGRAAIHWHDTGSLTLRPSPLRPAWGTWTRIAAGNDDRLYLLDAATSAGGVIGPDNQVVTATMDGPGVLAAIRPAGVDVDPAGGLQLPGVAHRVDRSGRPACEQPSTLVSPVLPGQGHWISDQLDSEIYRCQWHRIRVEAQLPPATSLRLSTYSQDGPAPIAQIAALPDGEWRPMGAVRDGDGDGDVLILSGPGRFLWLRLDLLGDGYSTPSVSSLRVEYPRNSYLRFLPAVYSADPGSADFLARFLAIVQTHIEDLETTLADMPALFDPLAVPGPFVDYLAGWLDVPVEGTWTSAQQKLLIDATRHYFRRRGTPAAIREHVAAYLASMTGMELAGDGLPQLVEGFRQRRYRMLPSGERSQRPLWSLARVARLQADRFDRLGEVRLVSAGDPELDVFTEHAYRFSVFVPAALAERPQDRQMLRRAIDAESPAHTQGELVLVRPAMCVGVQSHLGLDSLLAAPMPLRLTCAAGIQTAQNWGEEVPCGRIGGLAVLGAARTCPSRSLGQDNPGGSLLPVS